MDAGVERPYSAARLIESAHGLARQMVREETGRERGKSLPEDRPFLPQLDRALRKASASETQLAGGIVKITTESGRSYCFYSPPDTGRGGLADMPAVPSTCP